MKTANITFDNEVSRYAAQPAARVPKAMAAFRQTVRTWKERSRTRRALSQLAPRMLDDAGIEPYEAIEEARKPFWRA